MVFGRVSRTAFDILGTFLVLLVIAAGVLGWRLSLGPISLGSLTPLVERALNPGDGAATVAVDDTVLAWAGWRRTFDIRVRGVRMLGGDGKLTLEVPEVAVSFSALALLRGLIAPTALEVTGIQLVLSREADGTLRFTTSAETADSPSPMSGLLAELLAPPDTSRSLGYLRSVTIRGAGVTIADAASGRTFAGREADITVYRDEGGLRADINGTADLGGKPLSLSATGTYRADDGTINVSAGLANVDPAQLATLDPALAALTGIDMALSGRIGLVFDRQLRLTSASFDLVGGGGGRLAAAAFSLPRDAAVRSVSLRGRVEAGFSAIELTDAQLDLGGAAIGLRGRIEGLDGQPRAAGAVTVRNVPTDELRHLWPRGMADNARNWIIENLSGGIVGETTANFAVRRAGAAGSKWTADQVAGTLRFTGLTVNYLRPMPAVRGIDGQANFTAERFDISGGGGGVGALRVTGARVALTALDTDDEQASVDVSVAGPLGDVLTLIDGPPLGYLRKIDLRPEDFSGDATVQLALKFPLKKTLRVDELGVLATAEVKRVTQQKAALGQDVSDGELRVRVDRDGMDLAGRVMLGPTATEVEIRRNFADNAPFIGRTKARGRVASSADRTRFGFDFSPHLEGPVDLAVDYVERRGSGEVVLDATLDAATLAFAPIEWEKAAGKPATARFRVALAGGKATGIPEFHIAAGEPAAGGLQTAGKVSLADDGRTITRIDLSALKVGLTDASGYYVRSGSGAVTVDISGIRFDAGPFMRDRTPPAPDRPQLDLRVDVDRLYFAADRSLAHLRFRGQRSTRRWETAELSAYTGDGIQLSNQVVLVLAKQGERQALNLNAENAGAFFKALDITPNVVGGRLEGTGATDMNRAGAPLVGKLHVSEFRAVRAPLLARVLGVALLTGIVDSLTGEGIRFTRLDADYAFFDPRLEVTEASAAGPAMGITAKGIIDVEAETIDLDGTIVPANALNSLPARIPLIGQLLTGGGGGIFAANYRISGPLEDATVSVNPLSTLAPGFLRGLFGIFSGGAATPESDPTPHSERELQRERPTVPPAAPAPAPPATAPP